MAALFRYELKKLFSRRLNWVFLLLCLLAAAYSQKQMVEDRLSGRVQGLRDVYGMYEGRVLTDALKVEIGDAMNRYVSGNQEETANSIVYDGNGEAMYVSGEGGGYDDGVMQAYTDLLQCETVEERRTRAEETQIVLDSGHYESGTPMTPEGRKRSELILEGYRTTPVIRYAGGLLGQLETFQTTGIYILLLLALALSPLFSGERAAKMDGVLLCAARRGRAALAKLAAAFCYALVLYLVFYGLQLAVLAFTYGLDGLDLPAAGFGGWRVWYGGATLGVALLRFGLVTLAAVLLSAAVAALASALARHPMAGLLGYAAFFALQFELENIRMSSEVWGLGFLGNPPWSLFFNKTFLMPVVTLFDDGSIYIILSQARNFVLGLLVPLIVTAMCAWLAPRLFLKRRKA